MWTWIIIGLGYLIAMGAYRFLGGFGSAAQAFQLWGQSRAVEVARASSSS
jgi:hypothetical protein